MNSFGVDVASIEITQKEDWIGNPYLFFNVALKNKKDSDVSSVSERVVDALKLRQQSVLFRFRFN